MTNTRVLVTGATGKIGGAVAAETTDAVASFCAASVTNDVDGMMTALAPDAELVSPMFARMVVRGHDDLRVVLEVVFGGLRDLQWREFIGDGQTRVAVGDARIFGLRIYDAMVIDLDDAGRIRRLRLHLRGWLPITVRTLEVGLKLGRYPRLVGRALRVHPA
jgi:uncharacterized protein YbjT (DUF2867 family)